jgi:hypothetical protein
MITTISPDPNPPAYFNRFFCYLDCLILVAVIDDNLTTGRAHYRNRAGRLLLTLDEVVLAILKNDLLFNERNQNDLPDDLS